MKEIIFHGRGGQGAVLAAQALASAAVFEDKYAMAFPHFGAERRGAPVAAFARIAEGRILTKAHIYRPDYVIVLDPWLAGLVDVAKGMEGHEGTSGGVPMGSVKTDICQGLNKKGAAVLNTAFPPDEVRLSLEVCVGTVDATTIALETLGHPATNSCMLGAFARTTEEVSIGSIEKGIMDVFGERLGEDIAERNVKAAKLGFEMTEVGMCSGGREFPAQKKWLPDVDELPLGCAIESLDTEYGKLGPGSTVQNETGSWRTFHPIVDDQKCTYCMLCWFHGQGGGGMRRVVGSNYATAHAVMRARVEVIAAYPITPQTQMVEHIAKFINDGIMDCEYIKVEGEHSSISAVIASQAAGVRSFTSTASQGLALMHELLFSAGGLRLPIVMGVVNRSVGSTGGIWVEYNDSMPQRDCGWLQMYVETNQEVHDMILQAYKIAEDKRVLLPIMICSDGFILSHTVEPVELAEQEEVDEFLPKYHAEHSYLDPKDPIGSGIVTPREYRQEFAYQIHRAMLEAKDVIEEVNRDFADKFGRDHSGLIEAELVDDAEVILLTLGTVTSTARGVVRELRKKGKKVGLVKVRAFRPYPAERIAEVCKDAKAVGVYDRSVSFGVGGPHYLEVRNALFDSDVPVIDFIGGLGGRDVAEADVRSMYDVLLEAAKTGKAKRNVEWVNTRGVVLG